MKYNEYLEDVEVFNNEDVKHPEVLQKKLWTLITKGNELENVMICMMLKK